MISAGGAADDGVIVVDATDVLVDRSDGGVANDGDDVTTATSSFGRCVQPHQHILYTRRVNACW